MLRRNLALSAVYRDRLPPLIGYLWAQEPVGLDLDRQPSLIGNHFGHLGSGGKARGTEPAGHARMAARAGRGSRMHQLLLLRHAKAEKAVEGASDHERELAAAGVATTRRMAAAMRALGLAPDLILVSTARRTMQTLAALDPLGEEAALVEPCEQLYMTSAAEMLALLRAVPETVRSLLLIGHNPGLQQLALMLCATEDRNAEARARLVAKYPTAALAEFLIPGPWQRLDKGSGRLLHFLLPKDLPAMKS